MKSRFYRHVMQLGWSLVRFSQRRCGPSISTEYESTFNIPVKVEYIGPESTSRGAVLGRVMSELAGSTLKSSRGA